MPAAAIERKQLSLQETAFVALLRTAEQLQRRAATMLKPHGLSPTQYNALRILRGAGAEGLACSEIAKRMIHRDPDITRLLNRLEARRLIMRRRGKQDRRVVTTQITPAGLELLKKMDSAIEEFHCELLGHLGQRRLKSLIALLEAARGLEIESRTEND